MNKPDFRVWEDERGFHITKLDWSAGPDMPMMFTYEAVCEFLVRVHSIRPTNETWCGDSGCRYYAFA